MPLPEGMQHDNLGPVVWHPGMTGAPIAGMGPEATENAFNLDVDRIGRRIPRPGSVFQSRIGRGPVVGLHEHTFEVGSRRPRHVAVVQNAFSSVHALNDPNGEPSPEFSVGFCPDWRVHGQLILPMVARPTDRFRFVSFLNQLYVAGGTLDHRIWRYDYDMPFFDSLDGVRGTVIVAQGNRLYVGGDPLAPNILYPSEPNEPEIFPPQLGIQIGTRNDEILAAIPHNGLIFILTNRSCHWLLAGAIELGDFQTEEISPVHGVVGRLAVAEAADGWVYWISSAEGLVRWRRGSPGVDTEFSVEVSPIANAMLRGDLSGAVVTDDISSGCVRFMIPSGVCAPRHPSYVLSYFYRTGDWTHGAQTLDPGRAAKVRDIPTKQHVSMGGDLYTSAVSFDDPLLGGHRVFAGGTDGSIYIWKRYVQDFMRGYDFEHQDFICMLRPGPLELAPIGHRAMIHRCILDILAGYNFEFDIRSERDYEDVFRLFEEVRHHTRGGVADELILDHPDQGRPLDHLFHPMHQKIGLWEDGLAKIVRMELRFRPEWPVVMAGLEFQRSISAEGEVRTLTPPIPYPLLEKCLNPLVPCPVADDPSTWFVSQGSLDGLPLELALPSLLPPATGYAAVFVRTWQEGGEQELALLVGLYSGETLITEWTVALTEEPTTHELALNLGEIASVSDWSDLRVHLQRIVVSPGSISSMFVSSINGMVI